MAQENSFDVVSELNMQEVDNALNQARKELGQRYDFKGSKTSLELQQKEKKITVLSDDDFKLKSVVDVLQNKFIKRGISLKSLTYGAIEPAAGGTVKQEITLQVGIEKENAKTVVKLVKDLKLRVQAQIMDDQIRVSGKNKDDLQAVMAMLREKDLPFAMQFVNYR
jgi:cyclic-di-GMP-binding protein